ncbi:18700_t:CDS:1 [Racocetra fulgida]|uniref:18700_t:CDS:1 n=1 Tax=Racocetra fulgida TaxID=60492 RepID=A0A9N9FBJ1_9GLOM|nr:18700_t:CDS:1 [Racocetra fulgida]
MVNSQVWLDNYYPVNGTCIRVEDKENYGKTRNQIVNLDISNQNLESALDLGSSFANLKTLNSSFNKLTDLTWGTLYIIEKYDGSHNQLNGSYSITSSNIKNINISHNNITAYNYNTPNLAYLDVSSNLFTTLDLYSTQNLVELKCSNNPISSLTLNQTSKLVLFDCFDVKLVSTSTSPLFTPSTSLSPTVTIYTNTLLGTTIGLGVYSGISTLCLLFLGFVFFYKRSLLKNSIPTPGSHII